MAHRATRAGHWRGSCDIRRRCSPKLGATRATKFGISSLTASQVVQCITGLLGVSAPLTLPGAAWLRPRSFNLRAVVPQPHVETRKPHPAMDGEYRWPTACPARQAQPERSARLPARRGQENNGVAHGRAHSDRRGARHDAGSRFDSGPRAPIGCQGNAGQKTMSLRSPSALQTIVADISRLSGRSSRLERTNPPISQTHASGSGPTRKRSSVKDTPERATASVAWCLADQNSRRRYEMRRCIGAGWPDGWRHRNGRSLD